ncbi:MAG: hypothetical protein HQK89_18370 [Nitrospirae bacterium]|nr:hypothetical protein [Nitrospirota bacterium]
MNMQDLKDHPITWLISVCVATGVAVGGVTHWFDNVQINSITQKYEAKIEKLNLDLAKKTNNCDECADEGKTVGNVHQKISGKGGRNINSGRDTIINQPHR